MSYNFAQQSSSGASSGSLFGTSGSSGNASGNMFGGGGGGGGGGGTGFSFGSRQNTGSAADGSKTFFGATPDSKAGGNIFGQQSSSEAGSGSAQGFSFPPKKDDQGTNSGASSIFGTPKPASPAFGASATPATAQSQPTWAFKNPSTTPAGPPPQPSAFGASTGGAGNIFGGNKTGQDNTSKTPTFSLGKPTETSAPLSGPAPQSSTSNLFGGASNSQQSNHAATGLFAQASNPAEKPAEPPRTASATQPGQKSIFNFQPTGSAPATTGDSNTPSAFKGPASKPAASPSLFGATSANTQPTRSQSSGATLFSQPSTTSSAEATQKPALSFQPASTQAQSLTPATISEPNKPLFGALGGAPPSAPPSKSLFGAAPVSSAGQSPATTTAATTAPTTSSAPGGFSFGASAAPSHPAPISTAGFAASTSGPLPQVQSRLKNKTMDEILTRWATDLTKYTKEFKSHAETVAKWDQVIVDNSSKIDKLYVKTRTCEKQTMSVEMQLSAVENQQTELESWLTKYENDVEAMLSKESATPSELGGPDQERERTYKLAEKLAERLDEMGKDLSSMVDEVNAANASLSKSGKADEPITQIVQILNSHLSQLQAIDQGTAALQTRVTEAQKAATGLGYLNGGANGDGRAADDFYRSYMGRR